MTVDSLGGAWQFRAGVTYLNHGSFGAVPLLVRAAQQSLRQRCEDQPMDFLVRDFESLWLAARRELTLWLGTHEQNIALCENATAGMNELASWFPLAPGDEVLLNEHEYGAVKRIWQRRCQQSAATIRYLQLPGQVDDPDQIVETIVGACSHRTRLVVVSHITSPSAMIMPVEQLCPKLRDLGIAVCVDGPHALLQQSINLNQLDCDFYTASCHKWLCAPIGSGFLFIHPRWHDQAEPLRLSWGRLPPEQPSQWSDEFLWTGTRDCSAMLSIPAAIDFFRQVAMAELDQRNHALARYTRTQLLELPGTQPLYADSRQLYGWMVAIKLPVGDHNTLQERLWSIYRIEVPVHFLDGRFLIRVSCHAYNTERDIDALLNALSQEL